MMLFERLRARPPWWVCASCRGAMPWPRRLRQVQQVQQGKRTFFWRTTSGRGADAAGALETGKAATATQAGGQRGDASELRQDDALVRAVFDSAETWKAFAQGAASQPRTGLFGNAYLKSPEGFVVFARASLERAQQVVGKVAAARTTAEYRAVVRDLDQLSDLLCRVIDLCDFARMMSPDGATQAAAHTAWAATYQYMNELNTTRVLHDQLGIALGRPEVVAAWTEEERTVAEILQLDFSKSAVHLPQAARDRFVALSQQISEVGTRFVDTMAPAQAWVAMPSTACRGLDPVVARRYTMRGGRTLRLPAVGGEAALGLRTIHDGDMRKALYYATRTAAPASVRLLERLLGLRAELAQLAGFTSYAHMALRGRMMAKTPESVQRFLLSLASSNKPVVQRELGEMLAVKKGAEVLHPWDRDYYMAQLRAQAPTRKEGELSHYFSLGTVMQGLSRLLQRLYGLRFVPRATPPGETWHPDVRRLDVMSDTDGHVAVLYCDLFFREGKVPHPAHFTVRCSRTISEGELGEAAAGLASGTLGPGFGTVATAANDGMAVGQAGDGVVQQLPTIALVCDFAPSRPGRPALLAFHEVETLFHEMGHAVHSILARTGLQTVAGTRCATDLAELPSTLMEHFAADPAVLALFARHYETDAPVDAAAVAEGLQRARRFAGLDDETQIVLALLDQAYHTQVPADSSGFDSTAVFHALQADVAALGKMSDYSLSRATVDPPGTAWQGFFGHLFGYGSTYYSYLFDRVLAERVWRQVFAAGADGAALQRDRGEHLCESLLRWGGGRDPWRCVSDALRDPRIAEGDADAMALVGSWGTRA